MDTRAITCRFEREGQRLVVRLTGPPINLRLRQAIAVRILDAVWDSGRTYGQIDVDYQATEETQQGEEP